MVYEGEEKRARAGRAYLNRLGTLELLLDLGNSPIQWNDTLEHYRIYRSSITISIEVEQQDTGMSWTWTQQDVLLLI